MIDISTCDAEKCQMEIAAGKRLMDRLSTDETFQRMIVSGGGDLFETHSSIEKGIAKYENRLAELKQGG